MSDGNLRPDGDEKLKQIQTLYRSMTWEEQLDLLDWLAGYCGTCGSEAARWDGRGELSQTGYCDDCCERGMLRSASIDECGRA
jgi:hypothetical protein